MNSFYITSDPKNKNIGNFKSLSMNNIDDITNFSATNIICDSLEYFPQEQLNTIIVLILQKAAISCQIIFTIHNIYEILQQTIAQKFSLSDLVAVVKPLNCLITEKDIYNVVNTNEFQIKQTIFEDNKITIIINRVSIQ